MTDVRSATHPSDFDHLTSEQLRERYLVAGLFVPGEVNFCLSQQDRVLLGGAVPDGGRLEVLPPEEIKAAFICDRRELGIACLAGSGTVTADDTEHGLVAEDILYLGRGTGTVTISGEGTFYLVSTAAHATNPTKLVHKGDAETHHIGDAGVASARTLRKYVHADGAQSCTLAMGITTLEPGSVWNTMPCHTHDRRTEIYLYFDLPQAERVVHLCGRPEATRSMVVRDRQAVISPPWSVHFGAGTAPYKFVWATGGENLAYDDMDQVANAELS